MKMPTFEQFWIKRGTVVYEMVENNETWFEVVLNGNISIKMDEENFLHYSEVENNLPLRIEFIRYPPNDTFWIPFSVENAFTTAIDTKKANCVSIWLKK